MIFGVFERATGRPVDRDRFEGSLGLLGEPGSRVPVFPEPSVALAYARPFQTAPYRNLAPAQSPGGRDAMVFSGRIYNQGELTRLLEPGAPGDKVGDDQGNASALALTLLRELGPDFLVKVNGDFGLAAWTEATGRILLGRDRFGVEPLFYSLDQDRLVFGSSVWPVLQYLGAGKDLDLAALGQFLLFDYNPGLQTFWPKVKKLRPGTLLEVGRDTDHQRPYWTLSYATPLEADEGEIAEELLKHLDRAVCERLDGGSTPGVFLSGGMDSSSVLALAARAAGEPLDTFSYRCKSLSFDESHYARRMSEFTHSHHHEVEYTPESVLLMPEIVKHMNEPFCECGINIATYILARESRDSVSTIMTGDGGDELFGGHPVYEADKMARFIDPLPAILKRPAFALAATLPDSDKKLNMVVKIKRFAESLGYPADLLSHRWRIHYNAAELSQLISPQVGGDLAYDDLLSDVRSFNREADGAALLDRTLYSDYQTLTDFYLRRGDLLRAFGVEVRYPLFDHKLAEFCAQVPAPLKIKSWFDSKYIFKKAMEPVLPHDIIYRQDKLGHSIPMKNWLRDNATVRDFVFDYLSEASVGRRGYFNPAYISELINQHLGKRRNNTHRLWALAVLEMWMREHLDSRP